MLIQGEGVTLYKCVDFEFLDHFKISAKIQKSEVIARTYYRINKDRSDSKKISEKEY